MSIIDAQMSLQWKESLVGTGATLVPTNSIALETLGSMEKEGGGEPLELVVQLNSTLTGANFTIQMLTANTEDLAGPTTHGQVVLADGTAAGVKVRFPLNMNAADADATHFGLSGFTGGTTTSGSVSAWIQRVGEDQRSFGAVHQ